MLIWEDPSNETVYLKVGLSVPTAPFPRIHPLLAPFRSRWECQSGAKIGLPSTARGMAW